MPLTLRPATSADLPAIEALMNRAYRGTDPQSQGWTTESHYISGNRTTTATLAEDLAATPHAHLLVAGSPIHASVWLEPTTLATWHLGSLTVDPTLQNAGLGRQLLSAAETFAAARGARSIHITVINIRETLIAWYQRRGYVLTGHTEPFPYNTPRFGTPLRPDLHFIVLEKPLS